MGEIRRFIDFSVIWKKINGNISKEEDDNLQEWRAEHEDHETYYHKAVSHFSQQERSEFSEGSDAWAKLDQQLGTYSPKNQTYRKLLGGVAASFIIASSFLYLYVKTSQSNDKIAQVETIIQPGSDKAMLTTSNGKVYTLSKGKPVILSVNGASVTSNGTALKYLEEEVRQKGKEIEYNILNVPRGGEFFLELSDGTKVWLNSATEIRYPIIFNGDTRRIELKGEAYFEVAHDETQPFIVKSGDQEVQVLGTSFNINAYEDESNIVTTLIKGKVEVTHLLTKQVNTLLPNDQSIYYKANNSITQQQVDPKQYIAWKDHRFHFEDQSLSEMMKSLARWYDVSIFFVNENAGDIRFTGRFKRYEDFNTVKELIERTGEVKMELKGRTVIIE